MHLYQYASWRYHLWIWMWMWLLMCCRWEYHCPQNNNKPLWVPIDVRLGFNDNNITVVRLVPWVCGARAGKATCTNASFRFAKIITCLLLTVLFLNQKYRSMTIVTRLWFHLKFAIRRCMTRWTPPDGQYSSQCVNGNESKHHSI